MALITSICGLNYHQMALIASDCVACVPINTKARITSVVCRANAERRVQHINDRRRLLQAGTLCVQRPGWR